MRWWILVGAAAGLLFSDLWPSWWNLTVPAGLLTLAWLARRRWP